MSHQYLTHWRAPAVIIAVGLAVSQRKAVIGLSRLLYLVALRLPLTRLAQWVRGTLPSPPVAYRVQLMAEVTRHMMGMSFSSTNRLFRMVANVKCAALGLHTEPVQTLQSADANRLANSTWFGTADLSDSIYVLVYVHGGGFCVGNSRMYPAFFKLLIDGALAAGFALRILSIEYPLATNHVADSPNGFGANGFQQNLSLVTAAYDYLIDEVGLPTSQIVFGGDSAGGNIALSSCIALRDRAIRRGLTHSTTPPSLHSLRDALPSALLLLSPWSNLTDASSVFADSANAVANAEFDFLSKPHLERFRTCILANSVNYARDRREQGLAPEYEEAEYTESADSATSSPTRGAGEDTATTASDTAPSITVSHPLLSPVYADLSSLPPVHLSYGGRELLVDDIVALRGALESSGVHVTVASDAGMLHDYPAIPEAFGSSSRDAISDMLRFLTRVVQQRVRRLSRGSKDAVLKRNLFSTVHFATQAACDESEQQQVDDVIAATTAW